MKKFISILLTAIMSLSCLTSVFAANDFEDFTKEQYPWAYTQVMDMVNKGFITGYDDNTFRPTNSVTRLEVLALFSRSMGALEEINEDVLALANEEFKELLDSYSLTWGTSEIAFLLYRGVLTKDDLDTYLKDGKMNEPMPRYEAAIIITKAMGGQKEATSSQAVNLDFTDTKSIPSNSLQYVKYVSDKGIMTGLEDGSFSPNSSVTRAQMGVMLSRVVNTMNYTYISGKLQNIDVNGRVITIVDNDENANKYTYLDNVLMKVEGAETSPKYMTIGVNCVVTLSNKKAMYVDTLTSTPDEDVSGIYIGRTTYNNVTTINVKDAVTGVTNSYECSPNVSVTYNNQPASMTSFKTNDYITLYLVNGVAETVNGESKNSTISNAVISYISIDPFEITITHAKDEYNNKTYPVSNDCVATKDGVDVQFSSVYVGDKVTIELEYGIVTKVSATSSKKNVEGTIKAIVNSTTPYILVNVGGEDKEYAVANDVAITINGSNGSLYDFRVGDTVKIMLEGETVISISSTKSIASSGKVCGTVTAVNTAYGFIKVAYSTDADFSAEETVYCKDSSTKVITSEGIMKNVKFIQEGDVIDAYGTSTNGAFQATLIVVE